VEVPNVSEGAEAATGGRSVVAALDVAWRLLLVIGIPAIWILRSAGVIHLSERQALGVSVVLLLIALGETVLAATLWT
jgi:hypothetical protein